VSGKTVNDVVDARRQCLNVSRVDGGEHRHSQLASTELAVGVDVHHTVRPEHDSHLWGADCGVQDRVAGQQPSQFKNSRKRTRHVLGSSNSCCVIAVCFSSGMHTRARKAPTPSGM